MSRDLHRPFALDSVSSELAEHWDLPDIGDDSSEPEVNAVNRQRPVEPEPEETEEAPQPLTLAEIEAIQEEARQEGFDQGKTDGHQQGLEQGRLKGLEEGHQQGFEQGLEQGLAEGKARIDAKVAQWQSLLAELVAPLKAVDDQIEHELVELSVQLAKAVIACEVKTQPEPLLVALRQGMDALPSKGQQVVIETNAEDLELIQQSFGEQELTRRDWQLQLEPSLSRGSLRLVTSRSQVEMDLASRMETVLQGFLARPRDPVSEPPYPEFSPEPVSQEANAPESASAEVAPDTPASTDTADAESKPEA